MKYKSQQTYRVEFQHSVRDYKLPVSHQQTSPVESQHLVRDGKNPSQSPTDLSSAIPTPRHGWQKSKSIINRPVQCNSNTLSRMANFKSITIGPVQWNPNKQGWQIASEASYVIWFLQIASLLLHKTLH